MLTWINTTPLDQRRAFIAAWITSDDSIANLARRFRISRKTPTSASTTPHALPATPGRA